MADFYRDRRDIEKELEAEILARELKVNFSSGSFFDISYKKPLTNSLAKIWFVLDFLGKLSQIDNFLEIVEDDNYKNNLAIALGVSFDDIETLITTLINTKGTDLGLTRKAGTKATFNVYFTRATLAAGDDYDIDVADLVSTRPVDGVTYNFAVTTAYTMIGDNAGFYSALGDSIRDTLNSQGISDPYAIRVEVEAELAGEDSNVGSFTIEFSDNSDFDNVINIEGAVVSGTAEETDAEYLERIRARSVTSEAGSDSGYKSNLHANENVLDVFSVGFKHPLMERDLYLGEHLGAKADIYILGKLLTRGLDRQKVVKESYLGSTPSDIILENQPVTSIVSVEGDDSGELFENTSWVFEKDFGVDTRGSNEATDRIAFIASVLEFLDQSITRADSFGVDDSPPLGLLVSIDSIYDTPTVLSATPNLTDGTWTINLDAYPLFATSPYVATTPVFFSLTRVENITQGYEYVLTDAELFDSYFVLAATPNAGKSAPLVTDNVEVDYKWKHYYEATPTTYAAVSNKVNWTAGDALGYGEDAYGRRQSPALSQEYFANYQGEAPIEDEYLNIEYRYNKLVDDSQTSIEVIRPIVDDVQIRESEEILLDMTVDIVSDGTYEDADLEDRVSSAVAAYLAKSKLGEIQDQTDVMSVITALRPDFAKTVLTSDLGDLEDVIQVQTTADFPDEGILYVDSEAIFYNSRSANTFYDLERGTSGTLAVEHLSGVTIKNYSFGSTKSSLGVEKVQTLPMTIFKRRVTAYLLIDSEYIAVDYISGNTVYISERGALGTVVVQHASATAVYLKTKISVEELSATNVDNVSVISTIGFPDSGVITIGTEKIAYTYKDKSNFRDLTRGYDSTTAAVHAIEAEVFVTSTLTATLTVAETTSFVLVDASGFKSGQSFSTIDVTDKEYLRSGVITVNVVVD